jgi:CMP/dCMP kinase
MYKNIAISGGSGTGKTTLASNIARSLGWKHLNNGQFVRAWYDDHGLDLNKTSEIPEEVDRKIDQSFIEKMASEENTIFESRLAGFQARDMVDVFKVLCTTDLDEAIKRVAKRDQVDLDQAEKTISQREEGLVEKFKRFYGVEDYLNPKYFNLVVDTTQKTPEEILQIVLEKLKDN